MDILTTTLTAFKSVFNMVGLDCQLCSLPANCQRFQTFLTMRAVFLSSFSPVLFALPAV